MMRRKSGVGVELASLILILACLAGSFLSIIAVYRRVNAPRSVPTRVPVASVVPPTVTPPAPVRRPVVPPSSKATVSVPAVTPALPPEDPTPKVLAPILAAEAEQLLEASQANRKAQALESARQAAEVESERWRRRQSLIHSQLSTLESKVRKVEVGLDQLALERDALERELDEWRAASARAKSRPGQAILPHRGPNGTWRRPIIVECRNGAAVIQPQGLEFGLLDLESGFGPSSNRFVNAIAREAVRVQRLASPDGALVVPYIFFLVRPDGIRPYYEARGRLEPLGITFGYELADADWQVEFPNLDDVATWDGSTPASSVNPVGRGLAGREAEDTDLPTWPGFHAAGSGSGGPDSHDAFTFGPATMPGGANSRFASFLGRPLNSSNVAGSGVTASSGSATGGSGTTQAGGRADLAPGPLDGLGTGGSEPSGAGGTKPGHADLARLRGSGGGSRVTAAGRIISGSAGTHPGGTGDSDAASLPDPAAPVAGSSTRHESKPGFELALDGLTADNPTSHPDVRREIMNGSGNSSTTQPSEPTMHGSVANPTGAEPGKPDAADPADTFVWSGQRGPKSQQDGKTRDLPQRDESWPDLPKLNADNLTQANETDPASVAPGPATGTASGGTHPGNSGASGGTQAAKRMLGQRSAASAQPTQTAPGGPPPPDSGPLGVGLPSSPMPLASPSSLPNLAVTPPSMNAVPPLPIRLETPPHLPTPTEISESVRRQTNPNAPPPPMPIERPGSFIDRTFEVVVVCNPQGVILQPGTYRITAEALKDREGLFKKEVVALVKARRLADPTTQVEPRIRFLIQPRGYETYRLARSQFFLSGLTWPTITELANPDPLAITTSGAR